MRLQLVGASGGAVFAVLALAAFLLNPGPSSGNGVTDVEHYAAHGTQTLWATALVGLAAVAFLWFAETLAAVTGLGPLGVAGAAATAALYLVAIGVWSILADLYGGASYGTINSIAAAGTTGARAAGPVTAAIYAAAFGYGALLWTLVGVSVIAGFLAYRAERVAVASISA